MQVLLVNLIYLIDLILRAGLHIQYYVRPADTLIKQACEVLETGCIRLSTEQIAVKVGDVSPVGGQRRKLIEQNTHGIPKQISDRQVRLVIAVEIARHDGDGQVASGQCLGSLKSPIPVSKQQAGVIIRAV